MEFEELQDIWDSQKSRPMYTLDEKALHSHIQLKKKRAGHVTNLSELLLITVNGMGGCLIVALGFSKPDPNIFMYLLAAWMFGTALYVLLSRIRRINRNKHLFEQSMQGDLDHAIATASFQVRLSQLMRWNILPIGLLILLGTWKGGKSIWIGAGTAILFILSYFAGGIEHSMYKAKKNELQHLKQELEKEG